MMMPGTMPDRTADRQKDSESPLPVYPNLRQKLRRSPTIQVRGSPGLAWA